MKNIRRTTEVISVSLPQNVTQKLERFRKLRGQSRSAFIANLITQLSEDERWRRIYARGEKTAQKLKITSEDDIDRILHDAQA